LIGGRARGVGRGVRRAVEIPGQQTASCVAQNLAAIRVDGLQQPGRDAGRWLDAGADAQDEALAGGEVEIALETGLIGWQVDLNVADPDVAEPERARIEAGVELADQAQLAGRGFARVAEGNVEGSGVAAGT
jgi:hypothetical protein